MNNDQRDLSIVIVGASGDLARRKIFPALFALYCQGYLPARCRVFGFARSTFSDAAFRDVIAQNLTCRYVPGESCAERMAEFLARCHYVSGSYAEPDAFLDLFQTMREYETGPETDRLFYLAIPPLVFLDVARAIGGAGLVSCREQDAWTRVVIEKPFGRDRDSSDQLTRELAQVFTESQIFRIDHYLGKEVIQNLLVLRFANLVFEPIWNCHFIENVRISWKEKLDVQGRGGYFDAYGIIRDVMQNHLLQILSLVAMELPDGISSAQIRDEKVHVLRCLPPLALDDLVVGQYAGAVVDGVARPGYTEDDSVPDDSVTPTFGAAVVRVENARWRGVPFFISAGKALDASMTEIRIRFRAIPHNVFCSLGACPEANELIIRVQPDEAINLLITSKVPGLGMKLETRTLDLRYKAAFTEPIPDAYESLLVDVIRGEKGLFIRGDELAAAWDVFTPVLRMLDERRIRPFPYAYGSRGPAEAAALAARYGMELR